MNTLDLTIFVGLTGLFGVVYVGMLWLRSDVNHSFVRLFKYGYPLFFIELLVGVALLFRLVGQFEPFVVLGMSFELELVRLLGGVFISLGLLGCMGLFVIVGIGIDLQPESRGSE